MQKAHPRRRRPSIQVSRGQSEVLGFAILATLVLATIGGVGAITAPALVDAQSSETLDLMEKSFTQFSDQLADTRSSTAVNIHNVDIPLGTYRTEPTPTNITITESGGGTPTTVTVNSTPTTFEPTGSETAIVYDMGLIGLARDGQSVVYGTPATVTSPTASHTGIRLHTTEYTNGSTQVQGSTSIQYIIRPPAQSGRTMATFNRTDASRSVTITIKTQHPSLWATYAAETPGLQADGTTPIPNDPRSTVEIDVVDGQQLRITVRQFTIDRVL